MRIHQSISIHIFICICRFNSFSSGFLTPHRQHRRPCTWTPSPSPDASTSIINTSSYINTFATNNHLISSRSASNSNSNSQEIHQAFQSEANKVVKENDAKATNIELARRGQQFTPYTRRFDYRNLDRNMNKDNSNANDNNNEKSSQLLISTWKRIQNDSASPDDTLALTTLDQIKNLLEGTGMYGRDVEEMMSLQQVQAQSIQSFQISQGLTLTSRSHLGNDNAIKFDIRCVQGVDLLDVIVKCVAGQKINCVIQVKSRWEGDVYVTEAFLGDKVFFRVDRELALALALESALENGDGLVMNVKSTLTLEENVEPVTFTEVFVRDYGYGQGAESEIRVLGSDAQRVQGCVANVNVRTVLVPVHSQTQGEEKESYQVIIDGEADAVLSRGLLSVIQMALYRMDAESVLSIDPSTVTDELRLRNVLSKGRNDGLASIVTVVQQQIHDLWNGDGVVDGDDGIAFNGLGVSSDVASVSIGTSAEDRDVSSPGMKKPTVAMLLSGGVDSSVALNLLVRQGYDVTAFYLKIWLEDELAHLGQCPWEDDYNVCTQICEQAGVPLESISLQREYKEKVMSYTLLEAKRGRTPNPDIMCNSRVKFGCFYDAISKRDFDYVATGHYAQLEDVENLDGTPSGAKRLLRAPDPVKDQSYFLAALTQEQLKRVLFPIGQYEKSRVRELAEEFDLPNKNRPDSQGLCFLGKVKFDEFLAEYLGTEPGDIIDADTKEIIGRHRGIWYHTVGQRKGIGKVLHPLATSRGPWYVVAKDTSKRLIIASNRYDEEKFESTRKEFSVEDIQWITNTPPVDLHSGVRLTMKIRHGPTIVDGVLSVDAYNDLVGRITLDKKDGGLAPGQFVVFYSGTECLGSAVISEKHWLKFLQSGEDLAETAVESRT